MKNHLDSTAEYLLANPKARVILLAFTEDLIVQKENDLIKQKHEEELNYLKSKGISENRLKETNIQDILNQTDKSKAKRPKYNNFKKMYKNGNIKNRN